LPAGDANEIFADTASGYYYAVTLTPFQSDIYYRRAIHHDELRVGLATPTRKQKFIRCLFTT